MEIRKDFASVTPQLERLYEYSKVFDKNNVERWPHLKNKEDFDKIYSLNKKDKAVFEKIYSTGRDCAVAMSQRLESFNFAELHLTLTAFINSFSNGWVYQYDELKKVSDTAKNVCTRLEHCPWAVTEMINLFESQLEILSAVKQTLEVLQKSELYQQENGLNIEETKTKKKGMTMTQKISIVASIATIIGTIAIFFPNDASSTNLTSSGKQSPNIQTTNGNSNITYGNPTTNNYYMQKQQNALFLENTMLFSKPSINEVTARKSLCTVESGSKVELMGEEKDSKMIGLTWIKVKIIDGTCSGIIGWASKEKLIRK